MLDKIVDTIWDVFIERKPVNEAVRLSEDNKALVFDYFSYTFTGKRRYEHSIQVPFYYQT